MVSIIIPVYNTPPSYLRRCMESIWNEEYVDYEILLIDDGSSAEDCRNCLFELKKKDKRVKLFSQANRGVSAARNLGIEKAEGDFLCFVDADDEIMNGFLRESAAVAEKYELDAVYGSIQYEPDIYHLGIQGTGKIRIFEREEISDIQKSILKVKTEMTESPVLGSPCARLYRSSIVKKIKFDEEVKICEDQLFNLYVLDCCERAAIVPEFWYRYYQNEFSALHHVRNAEDFYPFHKCLAVYGEKQKDSDIRDAIYNKLIGFMADLAGDIARSDDSFGNKMGKIRRVAGEPMFCRAVDELKVSSKVLGLSHQLRLFCLKRKWYLLLYCFQRRFR